MLKFFRHQKGDISIVVIMIALLIGGLLLFQFADKSPNNVRGLGGDCISEPNPGISLTYSYDEDHNGQIDPGETNTYYLIKGPTAIPLVEIKPSGEYHGHFEPEYPAADGSKLYVMRRSVILQDTRNDLLFKDITDSLSPEKKIPGFAFVEIYIKPNKDGAYKMDPIKNYCNSNLPVDPKNIMPDANGDSFPPISFKAKDTGSGPNNDDKYWLFAYEGVESESFKVTKDQNVPGSLTYAKVNGESKTYSTWYNPGAEMKGHLFAIVDTDSTSADSKVAYKYTKLKDLSPFGQTRIPTTTFGAPKSLQLRTFSTGNVYPWGWWSPECKPAIYLYPTEKIDINVRVAPKGFLTYTDPKYPNDGWQVTAYPNGKIISDGKNYEYLYYESKIRDNEINKPINGFVVSFDELPSLYNQILPKLGLNQKEAKDFKDYWEKYLPESPYYFVGIMDENSIEKIEPLNVDPKPDSIIRVRLYFEALDKKVSVKEPLIITPQREGYALVEWGGLVKVDKNHPFTCSQ